MKRKFLLSAFTFVTLFACAFGLSACGGNKHTHTYAESWTYDETYHWHAATCEHTDEVSEKSEHNFVDGICSVCGYEQGTQPHEHTFSESWTSDDGYHWHAATCEHTDVISGKAAHTFKNDVCTICGYNNGTGNTVTVEKTAGTEGLKYKLSDDGTHYICTGLGTATETDIVIASWYNEKWVTEIGSSAFARCSSLKSIVIPDGVTSIGGYAFEYCTLLTSVTIGNSVTEIGNHTFSNCTSLKSITIPDSVTSIGNMAFYKCTSLKYNEYDAYYLGNESNPYVVLVEAKSQNITSCTINEKTKIIYYEAFEFCRSLTSINIPNGVTSIGECAFFYCTSLTSIVIPDSVTYIGSGAFEDCTSLTSIVIPDSVTEISGFAFYNCTALTSITIPDGVTSIGYDAFKNCTSLESINIPDSVTSIEINAFENCTSLTSVNHKNRQRINLTKAAIQCEV